MFAHGAAVSPTSGGGELTSCCKAPPCEAYFFTSVRRLCRRWSSGWPVTILQLHLAVLSAISLLPPGSSYYCSHREPGACRGPLGASQRRRLSLSARGLGLEDL